MTVLERLQSLKDENIGLRDQLRWASKANHRKRQALKRMALKLGDKRFGARFTGFIVGVATGVLYAMLWMKGWGLK